MNALPSDELLAALLALQTDIAVTIAWDVLHLWAGAHPLAVEHYARIERLWGQVWQQAQPASEPPTVYLYHGATKLTLVRETTSGDFPAIALADLACIVAKSDQDYPHTSMVSSLVQPCAQAS